MFFLKKKKPTPTRPEPDFTRVRLYSGEYYWPNPNHLLSHYPVCTLLEWAEDSDVDFPDVAMDCALAILDDFPVVVNNLHPLHLGDTLRTDEEIEQYLKDSPSPDFGFHYNVVTMTNGPDRKLASSFGHNNEFYRICFHGYRELPNGETLPGTPFIPDIEILFEHLHTHLTIRAKDGIEPYIERMQEVCKKYGKTLVIQKPTAKNKDQK